MTMSYDTYLAMWNYESGEWIVRSVAAPQYCIESVSKVVDGVFGILHWKKTSVPEWLSILYLHVYCHINSWLVVVALLHSFIFSSGLCYCTDRVYCHSVGIHLSVCWLFTKCTAKPSEIWDLGTLWCSVSFWVSLGYFNHAKLLLTWFYHTYGEQSLHGIKAEFSFDAILQIPARDLVILGTHRPEVRPATTGKHQVKHFLVRAQLGLASLEAELLTIAVWINNTALAFMQKKKKNMLKREVYFCSKNGIQVTPNHSLHLVIHYS